MGRNNHAGRFLVRLSIMVTLMMAVFLGNNMVLRPDEKPMPKGSINVIGVWKRIKSDVDGSRVFSKEGETSVRYDDSVHEGTYRITGKDKMETVQKYFEKKDVIYTWTITINQGELIMTNEQTGRIEKYQRVEGGVRDH